tara:strand:+ start:71 stop:469 length:399 start_codon:yes stop_codon:yes gene_type:complete
MKKPDHVVYNVEKKEYDAYKKNYPTNLGSPAFKSEILKKNTQAFKHLKARFNEINNDYQDLLTTLKWNELVYNSRYKFNPVTGLTYHLYKNKDYYYLSIIGPDEWEKKYIGSFKLLANDLWKKIEENTNEIF